MLLKPISNLRTFRYIHFKVEVFFRRRKIGKCWYEFTKYSKKQIARYWGINLKDIYMNNFNFFHEHLEMELFIADAEETRI